MLLKLIKIQEMNSGAHCEVWEANLLMGDHFLARVFVLNEHMPIELIYRLTVSWRGICIQGRHSGWQRVRQQDCRDQTTPLIDKGNLRLRSPHPKRFAGFYGDPNDDLEDLTAYLREVQRSGEEIRIEVCRPKPDLPGYPEADYHPDDYPIVMID